MNKQTVTILGTEYNAFDLLRQRANQLDAMTTLLDESRTGLDGSYHDYAVAAISDMAFEIKQLAELINEAKVTQ